MSEQLRPGDRVELKEEFRVGKRARFAVVAPEGRTRATKGQFRVLYDGGAKPQKSKTFMWTKVG